MKKAWLSLLILISVFILGGCLGVNQYTRPNTTEAEREKDYTDCWYRATTKFPSTREKTGNTITECTTSKDGKQTCTSRPEYTRDDNGDNRRWEAQMCMKLKRYSY